MDAVLSMGCSSSCAILECFSTALQWIADNKLHATAVVHFLGDFLNLANSLTKCDADLQAFITMRNQIGVLLAPEKTIAPTTALTCLGITLDTVALEARFPLDKVQQCTELLKPRLNSCTHPCVFIQVDPTDSLSTRNDLTHVAVSAK